MNTSLTANLPSFEEYYPFKHNYLPVNGNQLHYLDVGKGEPVVMVHGNPSWSFMYRKLITAFRGSNRIIVPDHIGCGLSDKPNDRNYAYTLKQRIDDLEFLLEHLEITDAVTLVLHDWGGAIGLGWAARYPEKVKRIILFNTAAFHKPNQKRLPIALKLCRDTALGMFLIRGLNAFSIIAAYVGVKRKGMPPRIRRAYCSPYNNWKNRIAISRFVQDIPIEPGDPSYDELTKIEASLKRFRNIPILIVWGMLDFVFDPDYLDEWSTHFPQAEIHRIEDAGHYIVEDAADDIIPLMKTFLSE